MDNKYQHYVPRFYLRNFSNNEKSVGTYIFAQHKYVADAPIKKVCGRDFLYGEDLHIEKWFQNLEGIWAEIIREILSTGKMDITLEQWAYLALFIYLSDVRTAYVADTVNEEINLMLRAQAKLYREYKGMKISDEEIEKIKVTVDKPNLFALENMERIAEVVSDLSMVLLHNTSSRQFVTSDCPVVKYNQLFVARNYHRSYGYGQIGIQCFLPISPEYCLVLYDGEAYECKNKKNDVITINAPDQIIELNKLFVQNGRQALYFNNAERDWVIKRLVHGKSDTSNKFNNGVFGNVKQGFIIVSGGDCVRKRVKLPQFVIRPEYFKMKFPRHAAGPLRLRVKELEDERSGEFGRIQTGYATKMMVFEKAK